MSREDLDRRVLEWIGEGAAAPPDDERFDRLARDLFAYQYAHNLPYRKLCELAGRGPDQVSHWREIPAAPTGAFKEARLATFPPEHEVQAFRTSGSTTQRRGLSSLDTLDLYEASSLASFGAFVCPDLERTRFAVLAPDATAAPDSSLSHMFEVAVREFGNTHSHFFVGAQGWDPDALIRNLESTREPVAVVGTAFAFVHLIDRLEERSEVLELPPGSRAMETGGFKGRSRELSRDELHDAISLQLGVGRERIVNQYGMCELASQYYEPTLRTGVPTRAKQAPPWLRTRVVDPETLEELSAGASGMLVHYDLANTGSVLAVQTSDRGRLGPEGLEVLGRLEGAEARGCSIAADALLAGTNPGA